MGSRPSDGISDRVGEIYVMLTWRCNLRCRFCPMWGERGFCASQGTGEERLTVERITALLREAAPFAPRTVTISGGEPLLSDLFGPLAIGLSGAGLGVAVTTNGTLLRKVPGRVLEALAQVNVSVDGPPMVLDRLGRGGRKTIDEIVSGLRHVSSSRTTGRPALRLLTVITPEGVGHLVEMLDLFEREGIRFDSHLFQHQMFVTRRAALLHQASLRRLLGPGLPIWEAMAGSGSRMPVDRLLRERDEILERFPGAVFSPTLDDAETRNYYARPSWIPARLAGVCVSPWLDAGIAPDGGVWLCPGFSVGNVNDRPFGEIWNGEKARALRKTLARSGTFPACRACFYLYNYRDALRAGAGST